jgi:hypothetical protein
VATSSAILSQSAAGTGSIEKAPAARSPRKRRSLDLGGEDLLDALGDVRAAAPPGLGGAETAATGRSDEVGLERLAADLGDRHAATLRL